MLEHVAVVVINRESSEIVDMIICYEPNLEAVEAQLRGEYLGEQYRFMPWYPTLHWSSTIVHPQVDADYDTKGG